jgi:phytoene synthase
VNPSAATDAAFASFEQKWLAAQPENAFVAIFLPADERLRASAFGSLVHELEQAAFHVGEPQVAATKLAWWRQELADAAAGNARHPITKTLFADAQAHAIDPALWPALAGGALTQIDAPPPPLLADSLAQFAPFYDAVAVAEQALMFGEKRPAGADGTLWTSSHLLRELADPTRFTAHLPLDLLARYRVSRTDLATATPLRVALLRDYLAALTAQMHAALAQAPAQSLTRRVRTRLDLALATAAHRASDPLAYLTSHARAGRWRSLFAAWREARALAAR